MTRRLKAILAATLAAASLAVHAHLFHFGITDIRFNPNTASTEIIHTYMTHDIEALLSNLYERQFDLSEPDDEAVLRKYVEKHFWVQAADRSRLPLRWVGLEAGAEHVVIYQEIADTPLSQAALIHNDVLIDFIAEQTNTLNINDNGTMRTLTFNRAGTEQRVR